MIACLQGQTGADFPGLSLTVESINFQLMLVPIVCMELQQRTRPSGGGGEREPQRAGWLGRCSNTQFCRFGSMQHEAAASLTGTLFRLQMDRTRPKNSETKRQSQARRNDKAGATVKVFGVCPNAANGRL